MTVTKLQGGLGNQMFQYAIAKSRSISKKVFLDFSFLKTNNISTEHFTKREFELDIFNIAYRDFSQKQRNICFGKSLKNRLLRKLFYGYTKIIKQTENELISIPDVKNIYFDGYFQSEKYFKDIRSILIKEFTFPNLDAQNKYTSHKITSVKNSVSVHIRRGDYLKPEVLKYHGILPWEYYESAINFIKNKFDETHFFVFSDDLEFAKTLFNDSKEVSFVEGNMGKDSWKDMCLMSHCKHHIIANSSFSWWGAWLGDENGCTIAPKNWFNPKVANFNIDDFIPQNWFKI